LIGPGEVLTRKDLQKRSGKCASTTHRWADTAWNWYVWNRKWEKSTKNHWRYVYALPDTMPYLLPPEDLIIYEEMEHDA
jgi:hypothetical protein